MKKKSSTNTGSLGYAGKVTKEVRIIDRGTFVVVVIDGYSFVVQAIFPDKNGKCTHFPAGSDPTLISLAEEAYRRHRFK
jgi:hypothetical protein